MTLLSPAAFYALFGTLLILLLHFLRSRERRREVSALFLWQGLPGDPQSKAARFRQQFDVLLLVQLGVLLALTLALAQPLLRTPQRALSGLAIVIDGSASMWTDTGDGVTRYEAAVEQASRVIDSYSADTILLVQLTEHPRLLVGSEELTDPTAVLRASSPTWYGDGSADGLMTMLESAGGVEQFTRIVVLSDKPLSGLPPRADTILVDGGENVGITEFSVRTNPTGEGISAFVEILNATDSLVNTSVRISDGENQTTLALMLSPNASDQYLIPFPSSRGSVFTATLEYEDDFPADNRRRFALDRPVDVRVYWVGARNRYLDAALSASVPVTEADDFRSADLIIANQRNLPAVDRGVVLLIQSGMDGVLTLGELQDIGDVTVESPDHPLLRSIDVTDLRIRQVSDAVFDVPVDVLLAADGMPVLAEYSDATRRFVFLLTDLMSTNLPVTIDFPLLIRNLANELVRIPPEISFQSPEVGDVISLRGRGVVESLTDADDRAVSYSEVLGTFTPREPGTYVLRTDRGAFALTVNLASTETALKGTVLDLPEQTEVGTAERLAPLWPIVLALAILLLIVEEYLHLGYSVVPRRSA